MEKWETSLEQFIVGDHLDPAWAIAQSNLARSYMKHLDSVAYNVLDYELVLDGWRADDTSQTKDPLSNFVVALDAQISRVASMGCGSPVSKFQKEIVMVLPTGWPDSLKILLSQVRFRLS